MHKNKFYVTDSRIDAQKLMNTAINIETLIWRLSNTRYNNVLLIKTNNINKEKINLSFERLFGKLINNQENMAKIISSQQGRMIQKAAQGMVSKVLFLPIGI